MKKSDTWIIVIVIAIALIGIYFIHSNKQPQTETKLVISTMGKVYKEIPLTKKTSRIITVETDKGLNKIKINAGVINMVEADCPDQICVHNTPIDEVGQMIVCLPNQVIVEVVSTNQR